MQTILFYFCCILEYFYFLYPNQGTPRSLLIESRLCHGVTLSLIIQIKYLFQFQGGWRSKSSRIRKVSERAALPFVKRTLARCKQFEDSGKSIFGQHDLLSSILYKPSTEKDPRPIECDGSMILDNKCKRAHGKAKRKCSGTTL